MIQYCFALRSSVKIFWMAAVDRTDSSWRRGFVEARSRRKNHQSDVVEKYIKKILKK